MSVVLGQRGVTLGHSAPQGRWLATCVFQPHCMQIESGVVTSAVIYGAERENWGNRNEGQNELGYLPSVVDCF